MKFYIYTLGCKVNTYESNVMNDDLINNGFIKGKEDDADIYIVNTCTVTNTADNKSMKLIRSILNNHSNKILVVTGCTSQNDHDKLKDLGISIILGNKFKSKISYYVSRYIADKQNIIDVSNMNEKEFETMKLNNFNQTRAFVKIEDGCNNYCSYCIIPYVRGNVRCKDKDEVLSEITNLVNNGHKEIVLTGIHTGHYNLDNYSFGDLLIDILKIDKLKRLRISSIEITEITDKIMSIIKRNNVLVDHMHIPLQSGSNTILKLMNRKYDLDYFVNKINKLREIRPNISITTDVIIGFPNETDILFEETIQTIKKISFAKLHIFPYSRRKGTKADLMDNQVPDDIKKKRVKKLLALSKELEITYINKFLNAEITFIPEVEKGDYVIGHTGNYLQVKAKGESNLLNKEVNVRIIAIDYPYVIGEIKD